MSTQKRETHILAEELLETSEQLLQQLHDYRADLELELEEEKAKDEAYIHLIRAIEHMLPRVNELETIIEQQVVAAARSLAEREAQRA